MSFAIEDQSWLGAAMVAIWRDVFGLEKMEVERVRQGVMPLVYARGSRLVYPWM